MKWRKIRNGKDKGVVCPKSSKIRVTPESLSFNDIVPGTICKNRNFYSNNFSKSLRADILKFLYRDSGGLFPLTYNSVFAYI